jgi:hypothetical protein
LAGSRVTTTSTTVGPFCDMARLSELTGLLDAAQTIQHPCGSIHRCAPEPGSRWQRKQVPVPG